MDGKNRIGNKIMASGSDTFQAYSPVSASSLPETFYTATKEELDMAVTQARAAQVLYKKLSAEKRAAFLRQIALEIEALGDTLIDRAVLESGLPKARITGERGRTMGQLNLFADIVAEGSWVEAVIDTANPERQPAPKPDLRKMLMPLGVVGVFTASNFPLAFSTAGGDTAAALAAGNAVIVKGHPYHPGTNELVSQAIVLAADKTGIPAGIFSSLNAVDYAIGEALVLHPGIQAITFTGSYRGGKALYDLAQQRAVPIPVFAEMGSINPVVLMPGKVAAAPQAVADALAGSITLGAGQFCTNPGLIIAMQGSGLDLLEARLAEKMAACAPQIMLHPNIRKAFDAGLEKASQQNDVVMLSTSTQEASGMQAPAAIAKVSATAFIAQPILAEEVFGPFSLLVVCADVDEATQVLNNLSGQLTATVMATEEDVPSYTALIDQLQEISGRLIFNGVPTGVEVGYAMQHGGPFPATTDARFTSVGADAIKRFARPVAFQDAPQTYLPVELRNENTRYIWRKLDGKLSQENL